MKFAAILFIGLTIAGLASSPAYSGTAEAITPPTQKFFSPSLKNPRAAGSSNEGLFGAKAGAPRSDSTLWSSVQQEMDKSDYNDAIPILSTLITQGDHSDLAYGLRAKCWFLLNRYDKAEADAQQAIALNKTLVLPWLVEGYCQMQKNDEPDALASFSEVVKLDPNNTEGRLNRGLCYIVSGQAAEGVADEDFVIGLEPENYDAYWYRVQGNSGLKQWALVKSDGTKMVGLNRNRPEGYLSSAFGLEPLGNGYDAVANYQKAAACYRTFGMNHQVDLVLHELARLIPQYANGTTRPSAP